MTQRLQEFIHSNLGKSPGTGRFFTNYKAPFDDELTNQYIEILESIGETEPHSEKIEALFQRVNDLVDTIFEETVLSVTEDDKKQIKFSMIFKLATSPLAKNHLNTTEAALLVQRSPVLTQLASLYFVEKNTNINENMHSFFEVSFQKCLGDIDITQYSKYGDFKQMLEGKVDYHKLAQSYKDRLSQIYKLSQLREFIINAKTELQELKKTCKKAANIAHINKAIEQMGNLESNLVSSVESLKGNHTSLSVTTVLINSTVSQLQEITKNNLVTPIQDPYVISWGEKFLNALALLFTLGIKGYESDETQLTKSIAKYTEAMTSIKKSLVDTKEAHNVSCTIEEVADSETSAIKKKP